MYRRLFDRNPETGVEQWHEYDPATDTTTIESVYDMTAVVEHTTRHQNLETGGYRGPMKDFWYAGEIPMGLIAKWRSEEGIDVFNKDHWPAVKKKLNDIDFRKLRTGLFNI